MVKTVYNFKHYIPLLKELVQRDVKVKYRRSILGYLWSLLNPLMMMLIVSAVFSFMFRNNIENYRIYLIIGQTFYNFFSESTNQAMTSLIEARALLQKIYIPKYIFPLAKILSSFINLLYSLIAVLIVLVLTKTPVTPAVLLFPLGLVYILLFCIGVGLVLSIMAVYFRDMLHLYRILLTAWMYLTPIFYSIDSLSPGMKTLIRFNPLYEYITFFRKIILWGQLPGLYDHLICIVWGIVLIGIGLIFFKRRQDGIILYL